MPSATDSDQLSISSFLPDAESTRMQLDGFADDSSNPDVRLRSTARAYKYHYPRRLASRVSPSTSVVKQHFQDWDEYSDESRSLENPRGAAAPPASSPGRATVNMGTPGHDSLYDITQTPTASFLKAARERIAKEEQQKDIEAVKSRLMRVSPTKSNTSESRRSRFASYKKPAAEDEEHASRPFDLTARPSAKKSRFSSARAATSAVSASTTFSKPTASPERSHVAPAAAHPARPTTPRSTTNTVGITQQSFGLPDLPNLTELMSGMYKDGTPIFSRSAKGRSRFTQSTRSFDCRLHHVPVDSVPVPEDEKAIYASLQLMKDKIAQLEQEKAESDRRMEEQDGELIELRVQLDAQNRLRRSDSGFGSDDDGKERKELSFEVAQLTAALESTQKKLSSAQRKLEVSDIALKRVTKERDTAVTQLGSAFYNSEELKSEQEALQKENALLRDEVDQLRAENDELRAHQSDSNKATNTHSAENARLRRQLSDVQAQHDEETQRIKLDQASARERAEQKAQREKLRLEQEKADIQARLAEAMAKHEEEARQWELKNAEMQELIEEHEETTQQLQTATLAQAAEDLRIENEKLKIKLAKQQQQQQPRSAPLKQLNNDVETLNRELEEVMARHEEESLVWSEREAQLREKIARLQTRKSILKKPSTNAFSQHVEKSAAMPATESSRVAKPVQSKIRAASARVLRARDIESTDAHLMSGGLPKSAAKHDRRASAPVASGWARDLEDAQMSDNESTTDLDLSRFQKNDVSNATKRSAKGGSARGVSRRYEEDDTTTLSFMEPIDIQKIRQQVEEDYKAAKGKGRNNGVVSAKVASGLERSARSPSATQHGAKQTSSNAASGLDISPSAANGAGAPSDETLRSRASASGLRSASSVGKHRTENTEDLTSTSIQSGRTTASASTHVSRTSRKSAGVNYGRYLEAEYGPGRRRRSAPEMTSAFILPDITMRAPPAAVCERASLGPEARKLMDEISPHDVLTCTVCYRLAVAEGQHNLPELSIPQPKPVTDEPQDDADATMRPAMSPREALATTIKQLEDELRHKKREMLDNTRMLEGHDPRKGSRMRRGIQKRIDDLNAEIRILSQNIYNLMDVLEGQKAAGQLHDEEGDTTFSGLSDH